MASTILQHATADGAAFELAISLRDGDEADELALSRDGERLLTLSREGGASSASFEGSLAGGSAVRLQVETDGTETWEGDMSSVDATALGRAPIEEFRRGVAAQQNRNPCDDCKTLCFLQWLACVAGCAGEPVCTINCTVQGNACMDGCPCG